MLSVAAALRIRFLVIRPSCASIWPLPLALWSFRPWLCQLACSSIDSARVAQCWRYNALSTTFSVPITGLINVCYMCRFSGLAVVCRRPSVACSFRFCHHRSIHSRVRVQVDGPDADAKQFCIFVFWRRHTLHGGAHTGRFVARTIVNRAVCHFHWLRFKHSGLFVVWKFVAFWKTCAQTAHRINF